jgi:calcineurin-like phosphoesterase family protein|tara:strand:- start:2358 stop:2876 length:519 start_codon:yes stop_codon:yes gene_type:complete
MGKTYVTSNLQLGRPGSIKKYKREFEHVDEMTDALINNWNTVVTKDDTVFHLGNFAHDPKTAQDAMLRLNGKIMFCLGEHDEAIEHLDSKNMLRPGCKIIKCIETNSDHKVSLSYYPLGAWPGKTKKWFSIIGYPAKQFKSDPKKRIINVSTDLWGHKPQELPKVVSIFEDF